MIEFNLLPDVKIAFIKAERQKRLVISVSTFASIAAIALFVLLFSFVNLVQKKSINDLTGTIKTQSNILIKTKDLNKMITVQNQAAQLDVLHGDKVVASRLFPFLQQVTPQTVSITKFKVDYTENTMVITGEAPSFAAVNAFADSLKCTQYATASHTDTMLPAFSDVVLSDFSVSDNKPPQYTFDLGFDPVLFAQADSVTLTTPSNCSVAPQRSTSVFDTNGVQ